MSWELYRWKNFHYMLDIDILTLPMLRLLSSKAQGWKDFWKPSKPCFCQSFSDFSGFLHHFVLAKLAASSIRVKKLLSKLICCPEGWFSRVWVSKWHLDPDTLLAETMLGILLYIPAGASYKCKVASDHDLKDNSTMYKTEAQIVSYSILYLNPSSHQCQPSYKKYIAVQTPPNRHKIEALGAAILAS